MQGSSKTVSEKFMENLNLNYAHKNLIRIHEPFTCEAVGQTTATTTLGND